MRKVTIAQALKERKRMEARLQQKLFIEYLNSVATKLGKADLSCLLKEIDPLSDEELKSIFPAKEGFGFKKKGMRIVMLDYQGCANAKGVKEMGDIVIVNAQQFMGLISKKMSELESKLVVCRK